LFFRNLRIIELSFSSAKVTQIVLEDAYVGSSPLTYVAARGIDSESDFDIEIPSSHRFNECK